MKQVLTSDNKPERNEKGQLLPGNTANPEGRPQTTEEEKIVKKATEQLVKEYKESLAQALPTISPVLIKKAEEGDLGSIKEINDRVIGKADQKVDITTDGKPLLGGLSHKKDE